MTNKTHKSEYFYGNKISDYGLEHGYVDYATLVKSFDAVLNNNIIGNTVNIGYWEIVNGNDCKYYDTVLEDYVNYDSIENWDNIEEEYCDIYQYYIISTNGARILEEYTHEIVFYNEDLNMYVWGVTHWGTNWGYVLTDIKLDWM